MSTYRSLKNVIPKRKYRERSQPAWRKDKGFLEKHQDYVKRAKRHHQISDQLNTLRLKAALKNNDEFTHKMIRSEMVDGEHVRKDASDQTVNEDAYRKQLKTRNMNMVKLQRYRLAKRIERERDSLVRVGDQAVRGEQILLLDDEDELQAARYLPKQSKQQIESEVLGKRVALVTGEELEEAPEERRAREIEIRKRNFRLKEMEQKQDRLEDYYLEVEKSKSLLQTTHRKQKTGPTGAPVIKFFQERKR